jgi:hypothetical protein
MGCMYCGSKALMADPNSVIGWSPVPHALKVRFEFRGGARVTYDDQVVFLRVLAARAEVRRARAQDLAVDLVSLQVHERAAALDPDVVGEVAELDEVMALARVEDDPDRDPTALGVVEGVEHSRICERV